MNFQRYVIIFFVILLLIIMIFLGVTMSNNKATNIPWPPIISSCPDYWTDTPDEPPPETISTCVQNCINDECTSECTEIQNPAYTNYIPIPHVPGSRCIGTIGQNNGSFGFDPNNSTFSTDQEKKDSTTCATCKTATMDFTKPDGDTNYIGANGNCNKQNWAKNHGNISWDGITYGFGEQDPC